MDDTDDGREPRVRRLPFTWLGLLAAGWVVYEITAQPALGTALICLKFGWADFRTARWLRRTDPDRVRGRACFWLYAAWGLWKIAAVASLTTVVVFVTLAAIVDRQGPRGNAPAFDRLISASLGAGLTIAAGFTLSAVAAARAVGSAWRRGYCLWLHGSVRRAAREDVWPPSVFSPRGPNRLAVLLVTDLFVVAFIVPILAVACFPFFLGPFLSPVARLALVAGGCWLSKRIYDAITAASPAECWPPDEVAPLPADPVGW